MGIETQTIEYLDDGVLLEGFVAYDTEIKKPMPGILIAHTWAGRDAFVCERAQQLAKMGYVGFAVDMYGKGVLGKNPTENAALMNPLKENRPALQQRMNQALKTLLTIEQVDKNKTAAIGYCFGGLCALDLARINAEILGAVSFHGLLLPPGNTENNKIPAKVLVLHGYDDPMVPPAMVSDFEQEMSNVNTDWQLHSYGGTMHAFTNPSANNPEMGTVYNPVADKRSWQSMTSFLAEIFNGDKL